jgi:hypothetical protein
LIFYTLAQARHLLAAIDALGSAEGKLRSHLPRTAPERHWVGYNGTAAKLFCGLEAKMAKTPLARMARFIIADLTDPSSIPKELEAIVPSLAVPVQPLLEGSSRPYAMFKDYWKYEWVLPVYRYEGLEPLLATIAEKVIAPAEGKVKALAERRRMIEAELTKTP